MNDIPPVLPPPVATAIQAVATDRAYLNDDAKDVATLITAAQTAVGNGSLTEDAATALLAAYGVTYVAPVVAQPPPAS